jgi:hypothetical protein
MNLNRTFLRIAIFIYCVFILWISNLILLIFCTNFVISSMPDFILFFNHLMIIEKKIYILVHCIYYIELKQPLNRRKNVLVSFH